MLTEYDLTNIAAGRKWKFQYFLRDKWNTFRDCDTRHEAEVLFADCRAADYPTPGARLRIVTPAHFALTDSNDSRLRDFVNNAATAGGE